MRYNKTRLAFFFTLLLVLIAVFFGFIQPSSTPNPKVVALAKEYLGAPYHYGGSTPTGFDCSGYTMFLFHKCGKELPRTADKQASIGKSVSLDKLEPGNLLFFATENSQDISHTGIYIGERKFIHASATAKKVIISSLDNPYWQRTIRTARQIP